MIKEVSGDILLAKTEAIAHGIAPNDHFNQGLAHNLRERWPAMYKDFRHFCHSHHPKVGDLWTWSGPDSTRIINLFTQEPAKSEHSHPGKASIENLHHCFKALKKEVQKEGIKSLAIPRIGTGVGGLDWPDVQALIEKDLGDLDLELHVYSEYVPGQAASS